MKLRPWLCLTLLVISVSALAADPAPSPQPAPSPAPAAEVEKPGFFESSAGADARFYGLLGLGAAFTSNLQNFWGDRSGGAFSAEVGYWLLDRVSLGVGFDAAVSGATIILFGTGATSSLWSGLLDVAAIKTDGGFRLQLGARGGHASFAGSDSILLIPVNAYSLSSWFAGPAVSFYWDVGGRLFLGLRGEYLQIFGGDASYTSVFSGNTSTTHIPAFGYSNVVLAAGIRL